MKPIAPLALDHSWPLFDRAQHFNLGWIDDCDILCAPVAAPVSDVELARLGIGRWQCDLSDNSLIWSDEVYSIFGLPRTAAPSRADTVALYCDESRAKMEQLRAYAIKHRRGFTVDVQIQPATGRRKWMRLTAAPVCEGRRVIRLEGVKQDVSLHYR